MRRFIIRCCIPGAGSDVLAEGVLFNDEAPVVSPVVARQLLPTPGPPIVWATLATMESVWCYGDLGQVEWIDNDRPLLASRLVLVSVLDVEPRLVLGASARRFWDVTYSYNRQPFHVSWPDAWSMPPVRGDQIELELDTLGYPISGRVVIASIPQTMGGE